MATTKKSPPRYDLKAQDRKRDLLVKVGLTAVVVFFAVGLVLYIVMGRGATAGDAQAVRVASDSLVKKEGSDEPKAVLSIYEDFQCPHCRKFEKDFGPAVAKLADSGAAAVDYYMLSILNRLNSGYSSRAANAAYCVADEDKEAFTRFHTALFVEQPREGSGSGPDNAALIEKARQAGVTGDVANCIERGKYTKMVEGLARATDVSSTPTLRLNGEEINPANPDELLAKVAAIVGPMPALLPTPSPAPPTPAPAQ